jgi:hypothetical protein
VPFAVTSSCFRRRGFTPRSFLSYRRHSYLCSWVLFSAGLGALCASALDFSYFSIPKNKNGATEAAPPNRFRISDI